MVSGRDDGWVPDWPAIPLFFFLVVVVFLRAGGTYALARGARRLAERRRGPDARPALRRAEQVVETYGALAIVLGFLTVGVQTAIHLAAGSLRMPLSRYLPALLVGSLVWAAIYVSIGLAAFEALWRGHWTLVLALLAGFGLVAWLVHRWFTSRAGG